MDSLILSITACNLYPTLAWLPWQAEMASQMGVVFYDFIIYFGTITGSAWFLIMMGAEMGALVVFKIRITRELETKLRLVLVLVAYFAYSIALPSFILSNPSSTPSWVGAWESAPLER